MTELEQAIKRYVEMFDFAPVAYVTLDRNGRIEELNLAAAELFGRSQTGLIGRSLSESVYPTDAALLQNHLKRCRANESKVETELRLTAAKGGIINARLSSMLGGGPRGTNGTALYQTAIFDLTERKRHEAALQTSEQRFRTLFDLVPLAVYACDGDGVIREYNKRAVELWGGEPARNGRSSKFCGSSKMFYHDGRPMRHSECPMARALAGESLGAKDLEITIERRDGERRNVISSPRVLKNEAGRTVGAINCLYDISERKKTETALAQAARRQQALYEFGQRRQEAHSIRGVCAAALEAIMNAARCDRAAVLLMNENGSMRFVCSRGLSRAYRDAVEGHSPWKATTKKPQPMCISDIKWADIPEELKRSMRTEGIRAAAFIPLIRESKLVGKLMTYYDVPHAFSDNELSFSLTLAGHLALGLEQKKDADALRESEELHRALVRQTAVGMARTNLKKKFVFVNRKFCEMLGYEESDLIGRTIIDITHPDDIAESERLFRALAKKTQPYRIEKRYMRKDGSTFWVSVSASPMRDADGRTCGAVAVILDIHSQKKAELALAESKAHLETRVRERTAELLAANEELQNEIAQRKRLENEVLEISDREQRRLGQDLHDGLCQHLTAIGFMAREMSSRLRNNRLVTPDEMEKICEFLNEGVAEARTVARGLHPVEMDTVGFTTAIRSLLHRQSALPYRLDMDDDLTIDNADHATNLYRIVREAVINANKHARANELVVKMRATPKQVEVSVTDDGIGLSEPKIESSGLGFHIMEYRARSMGARLEISAIQPHGTRVACYLPRK